jgi:hypothetical protein
MSARLDLKVHIACDGETGRWYVASTDVPGLWLEADSAADLIGRLSLAAPEMIALNEAEIVARHTVATDRNRSERLHADVRPVFDSPLNACA